MSERSGQEHRAPVQCVRRTSAQRICMRAAARVCVLQGGANVYSATVVRDSAGESKGYGFVHYLSSASYLAALDEYSVGIEIAGRLTKASAADDKRKVFIKNLPRDMPEQTIRDEIEAITGKCESFNISGKGGQAQPSHAHARTHTHTFSSARNARSGLPGGCSWLFGRPLPPLTLTPMACARTTRCCSLRVHPLVPARVLSYIQFSLTPLSRA